MTLRQITSLSSFGEELLDETQSAADVREQVISEGETRSLGDVLSSLDTAGEAAGAAFTTAGGTIARRQRALGQNLSEGERRVQRRRIGLGRALSTVNARNREIGNLRRRGDIARSSALGLRDIIEGQQLGAREQAAGAATGRELDFQQQLAQFRQNRAAGLGAIAGIGLSFVPGGQFLAPAVQGAIAGA